MNICLLSFLFVDTFNDNYGHLIYNRIFSITYRRSGGLNILGIIIVEICESNLLHTIEAEDLFESEYPEVSVLISDCLSFCGLCRLRPYALVNGRRVKGKDVEDCINKIRQEIEIELATYQ